MKEEYVPSKYVEKYMAYLEYERKLSLNTIKSYLNDLKDFETYFKGNLINFVKIPAAHTADIFIQLLFAT